MLKHKKEIELEQAIAAINAEIDLIDGHKNVLMEKKKELAAKRADICRELENHIWSTMAERRAVLKRLRAEAAEAKAE